jgi:positive regulator of sigma E activity
MEKYEHLTKTRRVFAIIGMTIGGVIIAAVMALLLGFVVMWLWNWLMPAIFGLTTITFWQAWGLVVLAHILFKSFPHKNHHDHDDRWKRKFQKKFFTEKEVETEQAN